MGAHRRLPARGPAPARDVTAHRRHDGRDRGLREDRRRSRRDVRHAGPGLRGRGGAPAPGRIRARGPRRSAHRRLRTPCARPALLPPAREGNARAGAHTVRGGRRRRPDLRPGARGARGRARDAVPVPDRPARSSSAPRATRAAPSPPIRTSPSRASGSATRCRGSGGTRRRSRRSSGPWSSTPRASTRRTSAASAPRCFAGERRPCRCFSGPSSSTLATRMPGSALGWTHLDLGHRAEARWCLEKGLALEGETAIGPDLRRRRLSRGVPAAQRRARRRQDGVPSRPRRGRAFGQHVSGHVPGRESLRPGPDRARAGRPGGGARRLHSGRGAPARPSARARRRAPARAGSRGPGARWTGRSGLSRRSTSSHGARDTTSRSCGPAPTT